MAKFRIGYRHKGSKELKGYWWNQPIEAPMDQAKALVLDEWQFKEIWADHKRLADAGGLIPCPPTHELFVESQAEANAPWIAWDEDASSVEETADLVTG